MNKYLVTYICDSILNEGGRIKEIKRYFEGNDPDDVAVKAGNVLEEIRQDVAEEYTGDNKTVIKEYLESIFRIVSIKQVAYEE